jgi:hypothetical protein
MMSKPTAPFQNLFPNQTLYQYKRNWRILSIIFVIFAGLYFFRTGKLTDEGVFIVGFAILMYFYQRSPLFLIMAIYLVWKGIYSFINFELIWTLYFIGLLTMSVILFLNFIRFQYFEQNETQVQFVSKNVIFKSERLQKIESLLAFYLGFFSLVSAIILFVITRKILPLDITVASVMYPWFRYIITYTTVISFAFGLAGWIGNYPYKALSIIGCIVSSILIISDIVLAILKI